MLAATGGRGVDVAGEFVGRSSTIRQAVEVLAPGGRAVVVGLGPDDVVAPPPTVFVRREVSLVASYGSTVAELRRLVDLVARGRLRLERSVTHVFPLDAADEALRVLHTKAGDPLRVVVTP